MKGKLMRISVLTILALFVASIFAIPLPVSAQHPPESIYLIPETTAYDTSHQSVGYAWNETVWVATAQNVQAWQVGITFNSAWLTCDKCGYAGPLGIDAPKSELFTGVGTTPLPFSISAGEVFGGESCAPNFVNPGGVAKRLMWFELVITASPNKYQTLTSDIDFELVGPHAVVFLDPQSNVLNIPPFNGATSYAWSPPPLPHMGFDKTSVLCDRYTALPFTFTKKVYIKSLDAAWHLTQANFTVNYNVATTHPGLLAVVSVTPDGAWGHVDVDTSVANQITINATGLGTYPTGDILVATIVFSVTYKGIYPATDSCQVTFSSVHLFDTSAEIGAGGLPAADVETDTVEGLLTLSLPWLSVNPASTVVGPGPVVGTTFTVSVDINKLDSHWNLVGVQFRLGFDPAYLQPVACVQGTYLPPYSTTPLQKAPPKGSLGMFYVDFFNPTNVLVGDMIYPNGTGWWNAPFPGASPPSAPAGTGSISLITFEVLKQLYPQNITTYLNIIECIMIDYAGNPIPFNDPLNGTVTITTSEPGRLIDLYTQYPAPYGGQGQNQPSDMFWPQKLVTLYAYVTYNWWPMQQKLVGFEVNDPNGNVWTKLSAVTDENGIATVSFRMPWPCENPESLFGVWKVTATVDIACTIVNDTMPFKYDYLAHIFKVTVVPPACGNDMNFAHTDQVIIDIDYGSHSEQHYPLLVVATLFDNVSVPVAIATGQDTIGYAIWCTWANGSMELTMYIPKFAVAGWATLRVDIYDKDPTEGGIPYCPEYVITSALYITPYAAPLAVDCMNWEPNNGALFHGSQETLSLTYAGVWDPEDDVIATASGGLAFETLPGPTLAYKYVWDINGTVVQTAFGATDTYYFASSDIWGTGNPLAPPGWPYGVCQPYTLYVLTVTATDFMGNTASYTTYINVVP